jgi:glucokinase
MAKQILAWDLGATKCQAGLVRYYDGDDVLECKESCIIKLNTVQSLEELVSAVEKQLDVKHRDVDGITIGAAGIYDGHVLHLHNGYPFLMPIGKVALQKKWAPYAVVRDYAPVVCVSFYLHLKTIEIHQGHPDQYGRRVAFGIGTGLGLKDGALMPNGDFWLGNNEMGHIGLCAGNVPANLASLHRELCLRQSTFEDILSGQGLLNLHHVFYDDKILAPDELGALIKAGKALKTLHAFAFYVRLFIAAVQLSFMPSGGIFMAGGVLLKHPELFSCDEFFLGLRALTAYQDLRREIPMRLIDDKHAILIGAAYYATKRIL